MRFGSFLSLSVIATASFLVRGCALPNTYFSFNNPKVDSLDSRIMSLNSSEYITSLPNGARIHLLVKDMDSESDRRNRHYLISNKGIFPKEEPPVDPHLILKISDSRYLDGLGPSNLGEVVNTLVENEKVILIKGELDWETYARLTAYAILNGGDLYNQEVSKSRN